MSHRPELLSALLDGEVTPAESTWVAAHLEDCGVCRAELDDLADVRSAVRGLPVLDLPADVSPTAVPVVPLRRRGAVPALISAAAAVVVVVAALGMLGLAADAESPVDLAEAEAILAATESLGVPDDGSEVAALLVVGGDVRYRAQQTRACLDGDATVSTTVEVTGIGSVTVMDDPLAGLTVVGHGSISRGSVDGPVDTITVTGGAPALAGYGVTEEDVAEHRGRSVRVVTVGRDGVDRSRLWIDDETGVTVQQEWLAADGTVACLVELVAFEPSPTLIASLPFDIRAEQRETVYEPRDADLPHRVGGLSLAATYPVEGGVVGVYGDGLFTVAVVRVEGGTPHVLSASTVPAVTWQSDDTAWSIVGAVPDDIREAVRAELPTPRRPNPVADGWRILFG